MPHQPSRNTTSTNPARNPRLRNPKDTKATKSESTNPFTGTHTVTQTTKTHHGNGTGRKASTAKPPASPLHHHRKPSAGDKVSGAMMKLKGSLTQKPGMTAAGTRRMHGTDGKAGHVKF
ncbi:hypothetical protein B0A50_04572 [Salinomyces thailandicus]|uniref:Uncharacterized protein n=1 Tax=Salinomyces thailandicus TaxID=706561 RepID=A0A4U0TZL8_9PEZI|nr:hypothetical protein B0A50_04572 [Salinomyces thailandica]